MERRGDYYDWLNPDKAQRRLNARLERLGWEVVLKPKIAPQPEVEPRLKKGRPCQCAEHGIDCKHVRF